jgi:hypothetical protein
MADTSVYTGDESSVELTLTEIPDPDVFEYRPKAIPARAVPIHDEDSHAIIGYRHECTGGVFRIYDLEGNEVGMEEKPLESPLLDPLDLIFVFGGLIGIVGRGVAKAAARGATSAASKITLKALSAAAVTVLRGVFRRLISVRSLKFTTTTAARMAAQGRYVPVHILHLAIKHGKRVADPQGVKGAFQYTITMLKNGKEYVLEVVVREADWTILHFLYK